MSLSKVFTEQYWDNKHAVFKNTDLSIAELENDVKWFISSGKPAAKGVSEVKNKDFLLTETKWTFLAALELSSMN